MIRKQTLNTGTPKRLTAAEPHPNMKHVATVHGRKIPIAGMSRTEVGHVLGRVDALRTPIDDEQTLIHQSRVAKRVAPIEVNPGCRSRRHDSLNGS